jgi:hypothetical protein
MLAPGNFNFRFPGTSASSKYTSHAGISAIKMQKVGLRGKGYLAFPTILIVVFVTGS